MAMGSFKRRILARRMDRRNAEPTATRSAGCRCLQESGWPTTSARSAKPATGGAVDGAAQGQDRRRV